MDIFSISILIYGIIIFTKICMDIKRNHTRGKQLDKNMELMRYHFWLREVGFEETAFMFNEFGITVSIGEEV